ncbi:DUF2946 family protein [Variovorax robiniae]|uniref:DUF2946 family protein n=1 Tax=Variovorax robiniae TaxID=1836199 RepID=A0ABU8X5T2_9BURK
MFRLLRHTRSLGLVGRGVLLWFMLSMGAAIASPIVHPQVVELVCSSVGAIKVIVQTDDGAQELGASHMDCPLCVLTGAPPPATPLANLPVIQPLGHAVQSIPAARIAAATRAPLPARGPPAFA